MIRSITLFRVFPFISEIVKKSIQEDSEKLGRRTAVGIDENGFVYIIVVPNSDLSLYRLMEVINELPIAFTNVLNLHRTESIRKA